MTTMSWTPLHFILVMSSRGGRRGEFMDWRSRFGGAGPWCPRSGLALVLRARDRQNSWGILREVPGRLWELDGLTECKRACVIAATCVLARCTGPARSGWSWELESGCSLEFRVRDPRRSGAAYGQRQTGYEVVHHTASTRDLYLVVVWDVLFFVLLLPCFSARAGVLW
jgi:hypothetical protein